MSNFPWLRHGATPALSDLGNRIADCVLSHGHTERSWLTASLKRQIAATGIARVVMTVSRNADGDWTASDWSPAHSPALERKAS